VKTAVVDFFLDRKLQESAERMYILFSLLALLPTVILSSPIWNPTPESHYDVIVVGGGPSGLSALSGLARVRRKALLIDSGQYRNLLTRHVHDVIGSDGESLADRTRLHD